MLCTYPGTLYMPIWVNPLLDLSDTVDDECRQTANSGGRKAARSASCEEVGRGKR